MIRVIYYWRIIYITMSNIMCFLSMSCRTSESVYQQWWDGVSATLSQCVTNDEPMCQPLWANVSIWICGWRGMFISDTIIFLRGKFMKIDDTIITLYYFTKMKIPSCLHNYIPAFKLFLFPKVIWLFIYPCWYLDHWIEKSKTYPVVSTLSHGNNILSNPC